MKNGSLATDVVFYNARFWLQGFRKRRRIPGEPVYNANVWVGWTSDCLLMAHEWRGSREGKGQSFPVLPFAGSNLKAAEFRGGARRWRSHPSSYAKLEVRFMMGGHLLFMHSKEVRGKSFSLLHSEEEINPLICHWCNFSQELSLMPTDRLQTLITLLLHPWSSDSDNRSTRIKDIKYVKSAQDWKKKISSSLWFF